MKMFRVLSFLIPITLAFFIFGCSTAPITGGNGDGSDTNTYSHTNRIAVIGDSISYGINPSSASPYGWVHMLTAIQKNIWTDTFADIGNFAVSGDTAADWNTTNKIQPVIDFNPDIVVVFIGANDLFGYVGGDGVLSTAEKTELSNNFIGILDKVTNGISNVQLVIVNYYDLFDGYSSILASNPMFSSYSYLSNFSAYTVEGDTMFGTIATNRGAKIVNIYDDFMNHCYGQAIGGSGHVSPDYVRMPVYYYDIHPITAGHQKICDEVLPILQSISVSN